MLLIVGASVLMLGCRKTELFATTAESYSPTGDWLATAHSRPGRAFGGGYFLTDVDLKGPSSAVQTQIVEFSHEQPTMGLVMEWTTPKHLLVKYQNAGLVSHVNECAGVDITVQKVANRTNESLKLRRGYIKLLSDMHFLHGIFLRRFIILINPQMRSRLIGGEQ